MTTARTGCCSNMRFISMVQYQDTNAYGLGNLYVERVAWVV